MNPTQKKIAEAIKKNTRQLESGTISGDFIDIQLIEDIADIYEEEDESYLGFDRNEFLKTAGAEE